MDWCLTREGKRDRERRQSYICKRDREGDRQRGRQRGRLRERETERMKYR